MEHRESAILRKMSTDSFHAQAVCSLEGFNAGLRNPVSAVIDNIEAAS